MSHSKNIKFEHVLFVVGVIMVAVFVMQRCSLSLNCSSQKEGLHVQRVHNTSCNCGGACERKCYQLAKEGLLYGCNPNDTSSPCTPELCNLSYRKCVLHGCQTQR